MCLKFIFVLLNSNNSWLFFSFREGFYDTAQLVAARLKCANNVFGGRLQQANQVADQIVLRFHIDQEIKLRIANICSFFNESSFQYGIGEVLRNSLMSLAGALPASANITEVAPLSEP